MHELLNSLLKLTGVQSYSRAWMKSFLVISSFSMASGSTSTLFVALISLFMAVDWAAFTKPSISAPLKFFVRAANSSMLTSGASLPFSFIMCVWMCKIWTLPFSSGRPAEKQDWAMLKSKLNLFQYHSSINNKSHQSKKSNFFNEKRIKLKSPSY